MIYNIFFHVRQTSRSEHKLVNSLATSKYTHTHTGCSWTQVMPVTILCNHHYLLLLLCLPHREEPVNVPLPSTSAKKPGGVMEGGVVHRKNSVTGNDRSVLVCVVYAFAPLLAFLSSRHQRRQSWQYSEIGCGLMSPFLIRRCLIGWSDWTGTLD